MTTPSRISRRTAVKAMAAAGVAPFVFTQSAAAGPIETVLHASFGANGMALADIRSLTASKNLRLVAVADVDLGRTGDVRKQFPTVPVYQDLRELLQKD